MFPASVDRRSMAEEFRPALNTDDGLNGGKYGPLGDQSASPCFFSLL
jgi:hypothetical protein